MKVLKIGFDVDDVINSFTEAVLKKMGEHFNKTFRFDEVQWGFENFNEEECHYAHALFRDPVFLSTVKVPSEYIHLIQEVCKRGHEVFFITSTYSTSMTTRALELIETFYFIHPKNIIMTGRKDLVDLDVFFDDCCEHINQSIAEIPVLVNKPWNMNQERNYIRVNQNAEEYLEIIEAAETGASRQEIYHSLNPQVAETIKGAIIIGTSGSGKSTIVDKMKELAPDLFVKVVTHTTRDMREGEICGKDYHFTDKESFKKLVDAGEIFEYTEYSGNYYGTSVAALEYAMEQTDDAKKIIMILDFNGAEVLKKKFPNKFVSIYIDRGIDASLDNILARDITNEQKKERVKQLMLDYSHKKYQDYCILNKGTIDEAAERILKILQ